MHMLRKVDFHEIDSRSEEESQHMAEDWIQWEGQVIDGRFRLQKHVGGSEQSAVFLVEQPQQPRQLAIKLLVGSEANRTRQLSQWKLAEKLSHPHLLRLFDIGRSQLGFAELVFVVTEYAEENLAQVLPHRPLTPAEALQMLSPALAALDYLHRQGLVHGCLKPAHVMAIQDQIKLSVDDVSKANEAACRAGAPSIYDAPETARGEVSTAVDVWSLGVMLTEVLTQRLPQWKQRDGATPVLPENLPAPFDEVVRRCLHPDPQQRWKIADIAERLNLIPILLKKKEPSTLSAGAIKKRFLVPVGAAVLAAVVIAAGARLWRHQPEASNEISAATPASTQATQEVGGFSQTPGGQQPSLNASHSATGSPPKPSPVTPHSRPHSASTKPSSQADEDVVHQVVPDVPQKALDTIHGTVRVVVRLEVDPTGSAASAYVDAAGPSPYFAQLATEAAKSWTFIPSDQDGEREFIIRFDFTNAGITASATRARR